MCDLQVPAVLLQRPRQDRGQNGDTAHHRLAAQESQQQLRRGRGRIRQRYTGSTGEGYSD